MIDTTRSTFRRLTASLGLAAAAASSALAATSLAANHGTGLERSALDTAADFEIVAELEQPPGNIAVTPDGRIVFSQHPFGNPRHRVVELHADGTTHPFPNEAWSLPPEGDSMVGMHTVIGIESDRRGVVWMLDMGSADHPTKLVGWDTRTDRLHRTIVIPRPVQSSNSFMQDLAIDPAHDAIYIADMGRADLTGESMPAIVVVDLATGLSRRVLHGHPLLQPQPGGDFDIDGRPVRIGTPDGPSPSLGLNPISIDPGSTHVYFGAMNGLQVLRIRTTDLLDASLTDDELAARVEVAGPKPASDGISVDSAGNVYVTDVNANAIGVLETDGTYRVLVQDERLSWPDGISFGPDGLGYATVNQLHRHAVLNGGVPANEAPYLVVRFRPLAPGIVGR